MISETENKISRKYYIYLIVFLGLLSAFGPFITDFYLPTLPSMALVFSTTDAKVQLGLTASLLGLGVGQIFFGPLSDKYGRKSILYSCLGIFGLSTVACIFSTTIDFFNICRFLQGLGGAGGIVLSRSIATDCYTGKELAGTLAIIGAINGVMPVIAPVIGGAVSEYLGWQGVFGILCCVGIILMALTIPFEESLKQDLRHKGRFVELFNSYPRLFKNRRFIYSVAIFIMTYGVLFSYISSSPFITQNHYQLSEFSFSLTFGVNAVGMAIGSGTVLKIKDLPLGVFLANLSIVIISVLQFAGYYIFDDFYIYEVLTFFLAFLLGFIFTATSALAMDEGRNYTGAASAVLGAGGYFFGALVSPLVGFGNIMITYLMIICICASSASFFALHLKRRKRIAENV